MSKKAILGQNMIKRFDMWVGITGLVISALLTIVHLIISNKKGFAFSISSRFLATMSYIVFSLLVMYFFKPNFNMAYIYIILGLILVMIADIALEIKNKPNSGHFMVNSSAILCVAFKVFGIISLFYFIGDKISFTNVFYPAIISNALTILIIVTLKFGIKLDMHKQVLNSTIYFIVASFMTVLAVWFAVIMPSLWAYAVFAVLIFINDLLLINVNFDNGKMNNVLYSFQRIAYYLSLLFLLFFLYFYFPNFPA